MGLMVPFEPSDTERLKQAMARWITDEPALAAARAQIARRRAELHRPTWNEAAQVLLTHALA